jgi:toxin-antitoxin system PIN domain toxin
MIAFDTNILLPALVTRHPKHSEARTFIEKHQHPKVCLCELVLVETYVLLRNPAISPCPLTAPEAATIIRRLRTHPNWRLIDYPGGLMHPIWACAFQPNFSRRRIFDARLAQTLRHHGVTEFATDNVKDFQDFGFTRVWSPFSPNTYIQ